MCDVQHLIPDEGHNGWALEIESFEVNWLFCRVLLGALGVFDLVQFLNQQPSQGERKSVYAALSNDGAFTSRSRRPLLNDRVDLCSLALDAQCCPAGASSCLPAPCVCQAGARCLHDSRRRSPNMLRLAAGTDGTHVGSTILCKTVRACTSCRISR